MTNTQRKSKKYIEKRKQIREYLEIAKEQGAALWYQMDGSGLTRSEVNKLFEEVKLYCFLHKINFTHIAFNVRLE